MAITLEWHLDTAVLLMTYTGIISHVDHQTMARQRLDLIRAFSAPFVLVADMHDFMGLKAPDKFRPGSSVFREPMLVAMVIVFPAALYEKCASSIIPPDQGKLRAYIVAQQNQALSLAEQLLN